jgi:hypothetical protein
MTRFNVSKAAAVLAVMAAWPAHAQLTNPFGTDAVGISSDDAARLKAAVSSVLQQYTPNARQVWQSADNKRAGVAMITEIFNNDNGQRCAMVRHEFTKGPGYPYFAPLCEVTKDQWRIAF